MTGRFKANNPSNNFLLLLYAIVLKLPLFLSPQLPKIQSSDGPLYSSFIIWMQKLFSDFPIVFSLITFLLFFIQAISLNKYVNDHRMIQKPNYLTGMSYLLITSMFNEWFTLSAALIINTILIWVWSNLCMLHNNNSTKTSIYNIGFVIGMACFFYYPSIIFMLLFMVGIALTRPFKLNEWLIGLVGICTSFYFFVAWLFLSGQWNSFKFPHVHFSIPVFNEPKWALASIVLIIITVLLGIFFIQNNFRRQVVQTRLSWQLIYLYLVVAVFASFVNASHNFTSWILIAVPVSVITGASFFYPDKKLFPTIIHWGMVAISITITYFLQ